MTRFRRAIHFTVDAMLSALVVLGSTIMAIIGGFMAILVPSLVWKAGWIFEIGAFALFMMCTAFDRNPNYGKKTQLVSGFTMILTMALMLSYVRFVPVCDEQYPVARNWQPPNWRVHDSPRQSNPCMEVK